MIPIILSLKILSDKLKCGFREYYHFVSTNMNRAKRKLRSVQ